MTKREVTVALVQTKVSKEIDRNIAQTCDHIRQAAERKAKIICLQELFSTPYFPQQEQLDASPYSEFSDSKFIEIFSSLAKELEVVIIVPFYEKTEGGRFYNSAIVFDEKGQKLPTYRKVHIPHDPLFWEKNYFSEGDQFQVYHTSFGCFSVLICYDQWFPEAARTVSLMGAELIFYPTAIGTITGCSQLEGNWHEAWETMQRSHAIANGVAVAAINRVGREDKLLFWGQSFICDAFGTILARGDEEKEEIVVVSVNLNLNQEVKEGWGFLRNRRPDMYSLLSKSKAKNES